MATWLKNKDSSWRKDAAAHGGADPWKNTDVRFFASCLESIFPILPLSPDTEMYQGFVLSGIAVDSLSPLVMIRLGVLLGRPSLQNIKDTEGHSWQFKSSSV